MVYIIAIYSKDKKTDLESNLINGDVIYGRKEPERRD